MSRTLLKKFGQSFICIFMLAGLFFCPQAVTAESGADASASDPAAIEFVDDDGRSIHLDSPCERIISLYSAHTENLYSLGVGDKIIGVHSTSIYPAEAAFLPQFDYEADPEKVIAAEPDLVLIRPFITRKVPEFVKTLETAGITVVSLYPERFSDFDDYILKLALLTGTTKTAEEKLDEFHRNLEEISEQTHAIADRQSIFFESTEVNLRTIVPDSMPAVAIELAGGKNVAQDAEPISEGSSIAAFGAERILELADQIDVYVSQRGAMNAGGNLHSITIRPGFNTIKAIQDGRVFLINEKIISSPTFRFYKGVKEIARYLYPEQMDDLSTYMNEIPATKRDFANILFRSAHLELYTTASSKYYQENHTGHVYGLFADVPWTDPDFDAIETVAMKSLVGWDLENEQQFYRPDFPVTREALAKAIFMQYDFEAMDEVSKINDLAECENPKMVQTLVDYGIFTLNNGNFEPQKIVTCKEIVETLETVKKVIEGTIES